MCFKNIIANMFDLNKKPSTQMNKKTILKMVNDFQRLINKTRTTR